MKNTILLLLFIPFFSHAQVYKDDIFPTDSAGNIVITEVIKVDSANAQELYSRAKLFVAKIYVSNKAVTQLNDDVAKTILIKPVIKNIATSWLGNAEYGYTSYDLMIECKDCRYRYTFSHFVHHYETAAYGSLQDLGGGFLEQKKPAHGTAKNWYQVKNQDLVHIAQLQTDLKEKMKANLSDF